MTRSQTTSLSLSTSHLTCGVSDATVRYADTTVLDAVSLTVHPGDQLALVGDNGCGKSTLLGVLAGTVEPTSGERSADPGGSIAVAEQNPQFPADATVDHALDQLLAEVRALQEAIDETAAVLAAGTAGTAGTAEQDVLLERLADLNDRLEAHGGPGGYGVDHRLDAALDQLGLGDLDRSRPVDQLSGGERSRLALAATLCGGADLLLLDEPTNDLDEAGMRWLETRLDAHRGALVLVTHDRDLLDRFAHDIVELRDGQLHRYGHGYQGYLRAREAEREAVRLAHRRWREDVRRQEELVTSNARRSAAIPRKVDKPGFGHGAFRARNSDHGATSRVRQAKARLEFLRSHPAPPPPEPLVFTAGFVAEETASISVPDPVSGTASDGELPPLVTLQPGLLTDPSADTAQLSLMSGDTPLAIGPGERWLVTGANGAGKSTLLSVLAGELGRPEHRSALDGLRVSRLRQHLGSPSQESVVAAFAARTGAYQQDAYDTLGRLGLFRPEDLERPPAELSVGQHRRLELAVAVSTPCDLLLLDEPTNHFSPDLVEQLEQAVADFPGTVVTVTHDRRWIAKVQSTARHNGQHHSITVDSGTVSLPDVARR